MDKIISWGIIGTGSIARSFATGLRAVPDARLLAVGSRDAIKASMFATEFGASRYYGNYESLIDDRDVDIVYIATPHVLHAENMLHCLHAGKPVLCEKPFAMNVRQASEVLALAREKKIFVMEAMWTRFLPVIQEAKRLIDAGEIGTPLQCQADFGFTAEVDITHRLRNPALGGGALLDVGIYPLSLASYFLGPIASAKAIAELGSTHVDEHAAFTLRHENGAISSCQCSIRARSPVELTIGGTKGYLRIHSPFYHSDTLTIAHTVAPWDAGVPPRTQTYPFLGNGYAHEAIEAGRCLREGRLESPSIRLEETLALLGWMDRMREQVGVAYAIAGEKKPKGSDNHRAGLVPAT